MLFNWYKDTSIATKHLLTFQATVESLLPTPFSAVKFQMNRITKSALLYLAMMTLFGACMSAGEFLGEKDLKKLADLGLSVSANPPSQGKDSLFYEVKIRNLSRPTPYGIEVSGLPGVTFMLSLTNASGDRVSIDPPTNGHDVIREPQTKNLSIDPAKDLILRVPISDFFYRAFGKKPEIR